MNEEEKNKNEEILLPEEPQLSEPEVLEESDKIEIDADDLSNAILAQTNVEEIVHDIEENEKTEKINKLTNEFKNILLDTSTSDEDTAKSVLSLFQEVLPNNKLNIIEENNNVSDSEESYSNNIGDLVSEVIKEASTMEAIPQKITSYGGLNIDSIISEFTVASTENNTQPNTISSSEVLPSDNNNIQSIQENSDTENASSSHNTVKENTQNTYIANNTPSFDISSLDINYESLEISFREFDKILNSHYATTHIESEMLEKTSPIEKPAEKEIIDIPENNEVSGLETTTNDSIDDTLLSDDSILDMLTTEDLEENLLENIAENTQSVEDETIEDNPVLDDKITINENVTEDMTAMFHKKIQKIEEGKFDNETLLISERTEKIYLPYKTSELLNYIHSYPNLYKSLSDVVKQEFILPYTYFTEHPTKSRYSEAYNLLRNREGKNILKATAFAIKMAKNRSLNPAIIASCKSRRELDSYLECLNNNKLENFKDFNIAYEVSPVK